jgi:hypothetical protein
VCSKKAIAKVNTFFLTIIYQWVLKVLLGCAILIGPLTSVSVCLVGSDKHTDTHPVTGAQEWHGGDIYLRI